MNYLWKNTQKTRNADYSFKDGTGLLKDKWRGRPFTIYPFAACAYPKNK